MSKIKITGSTLKIIALVTMLIDHIAYGILRFIPAFRATGEYHYIYVIMRYIGRVSFPLFAFLLVQGFLHTKSHARYVIRLAIFVVVSELPFNLAFYKTMLHPQYQNVFLDLLLGFVAMLGLRWLKGIYYSKSFRSFITDGIRQNIFILGLGTIVVCTCMLVAELIKADYGAAGVIVIIVFLLLKDKPIAASLIACSILLWDSELEVTSYLMIIPLYFYNGEKGRNIKLLSYIFYPAHLLIIYLIGIMIL